MSNKITVEAFLEEASDMKNKITELESTINLIKEKMIKSNSDSIEELEKRFEGLENRMKQWWGNQSPDTHSYHKELSELKASSASHTDGTLVLPTDISIPDAYYRGWGDATGKGKIVVEKADLINYKMRLEEIKTFIINQAYIQANLKISILIGMIRRKYLEEDK